MREREPPPVVKRGRGNPPHVPTKVDRETVALMIAAGIAQSDIARVRRISEKTLRLHYRQEIDNGTTQINTIVLMAHLERIRAGEFAAIKWWEQSRMQWSERIMVDDGKPADTPMRVIVEFLGEPAAQRIEHAQTEVRARLPDIRRNVQLVG
jgi:hypothetical protein